MPGNHGDLGYFTVFDYVYPFESGSFNTEVGKVSPVIRTEYGYHLIKVTSKREALGKVSVAHLYMQMPKNATHADSVKVHLRIDSVYQKLKNGAKWDDMVKQYSDDKGSAAKGGQLPKFGVNRMVPEFIDAIYGLAKEGDFSAPVQTPYGWHIIRLIEKKKPGTYDEEHPELKNRVSRDGRAELARKSVLANARKESGFTEFPDAVKDFYAVVTDSIFTGKWDTTLAKGMKKPMFSIGNTTCTQQDFTRYLARTQHKMEKQKIAFFVNKSYQDFVNENLTKWMNANLEMKFPDFKNLMNEYRDGILLFDLTDQKVWSRAVKDTNGLKSYYQDHKNNYMWDERLDASIYTIKDPKMAQKVRNFIQSGLKDDAILKEMNVDTAKVVTVETGKYSKKDNKYIDAITWKPGISDDIPANPGVVIVNVNKVLIPDNKTLNEARGLVTNDYQNYLEKIWVDYLRHKYTVTVNKDVLAQIK
jgi:peptidyl-prolyl cis-trans isomerase SurA